MNLKQMERHVIRPALAVMGMESPGAVRLLLYTGWVESRYEYVAQVGGPARSFWQVEPSTALDHFDNYLTYRKEVLDKVKALMLDGEDMEKNLTLNMGFAVVMARLKYWRSKTPMPVFDDLEAQANFWKNVYNTEKGAGTVDKFIEMCRPIQKELLT